MRILSLVACIISSPTGTLKGHLPGYGAECISLQVKGVGQQLTKQLAGFVGRGPLSMFHRPRAPLCI